MSSGFVSAGRINDETKQEGSSSSSLSAKHDTANDEAWRKVQQELAEARARKEESVREGNEGKSLYEVLMANKAAKQEAFEESIRLKNQYRALDDDEAEFLSTILEEKRKQEDAVKRETAEELERFRRQREEGEKVVWVAPGKKRKRAGGELLKGVKVRRTSSATADADADAEVDALAKSNEAKNDSTATRTAANATTPTSPETPTQKESKTAPEGKQASPSAGDKVPDTSATKSKPKPQPTAPIGLSLGYADSDEDD
ncbi:uncharacterized protein EI97DRAFT_47273 [Westerdykella ornata]|uniref:FAM192A/Fyv6 N-terminal domain-containing protein n=1 Tax=Westerdykella ornata TaxID=318751 RepID=A0A6A6JMA7_WESOR|nr:uncharacterized protein EI97DRAFT_47273 [Westerdykella ornata]KAF2276059.1 hypothetical protein EI97DRAFT_47273 [Westerdykella ornata]